jgi:hypothetical protein
MSGKQTVTYGLDLRMGPKGHRELKFLSSLPQSDVETSEPIARIARLMALAIRFERLLRDGAIRDYAELARLGHVTRARMTQITKLLDLAPDIQEQILFLPPTKGLNERNLRRIVSRIDWEEQRSMFHEMIECSL